MLKYIYVSVLGHYVILMAVLPPAHMEFINLSTNAAILSMRATALMTTLSPTASEAPCSSAVFCRRLSVTCSLQETTCKQI